MYWINQPTIDHFLSALEAEEIATHCPLGFLWRSARQVENRNKSMQWSWMQRYKALKVSDLLRIKWFLCFNYSVFTIPIFSFLAKIDCKWGPYGNWSDCTKSCGGGFQTRLRDIDQQAQNGGAECEGESTDLRVCAEHACPGKKFCIWVSSLWDWS